MSPKSFRSLLASGSVAVIAAALVLVAPAEAQIQKVAKTASSTKTWVPTKTPDGQPDLQGVWINATLTPFERPAALAGKATITEQEKVAFEKAAAEARAADGPPREGDPGAYNQAWWMAEALGFPRGKVRW